MIRVLRQILRSLPKRGLVGTISIGRRELIRKYKESTSFDRRHGVDTGGIIQLKDLAIPSANRIHGNRFQPTPTKLFLKAIRNIPIDHKEFVFIDFGSGKGRALLLAATYPFKKVIGVEFSPELHRAAEANIARFRSRRQRCFKFELICMDAAFYELPSEPAVFYFANPFGEDIMRAVLNRIKESLTRHPRDGIIMYFNPVYRHLLDDLGFEKDKLFLIEVEAFKDGSWAHL